MTAPQCSEQPATPLRAAALEYASAGLAVLPLRAGGKEPLTAHGKDDATSDSDTVTGWWQRWPEANVGVRPPAGVIVLDIDPRHGGTDAMLHVRGDNEFPPTRSARTGGGGLHIWFGYGGPHSGQLRSRGESVPGVDVKSSSGYLVMPPSRHPSGGRYTWIERAPELPAPTWLRLLLHPPSPPRPVTARRTSGTDLDSYVRIVAEAPDGELNTRLYWAACRAHQHGYDPAALVDAAVSRGHPRQAAARTAESAATRPINPERNLL